MFFEINVATLEGRHLFATAPRSCVTLNDAQRVVDKLRAELTDVVISVYRINEIGVEVNSEFGKLVETDGDTFAECFYTE